MKTTIYELLGMIKDGKAPKKILWKDKVFGLSEDNKNYIDEDSDWLFIDYEWLDMLNDEIIILETTITYNQDNYYQYQPYTGEVEIKCNSPKCILESDKIEKLKATLNCIKDSETILGGEYYVIHSDFIIALEEELDKINEIIDHISSR